ncbi:MAG: helix-turn-helix domain-containing protein [Rhodoplanes sp.]
MSIASTGLSGIEPTGSDARLVVPPKVAWRMLGVSNSTGYKLLAAGELNSVKFGRARRITVASIHRLIARRLAGQEAE